MHRKLLFFLLIAAPCVACGTDNRHDGTPQPSIATSDVNGITQVMIKFAKRITTASSLVRAITGTPPVADLSNEDWTYHHEAFESTDGYLVTDLEIRVRAGGFDMASFILLHLDDDPCLPIESFARSVGAVSEVFFPPSPHAANSTPARGYELVTANGGKLVIVSRGNDPQSCVTLITASPTDGRARRRTPHAPVTRASSAGNPAGSSSTRPGAHHRDEVPAGNDLPIPAL